MIDNNTKASIISTLREAKEDYVFNSIVQSIKILNVSFIENTIVIKTEDNIIIFSDFLQFIEILRNYNINLDNSYISDKNIVLRINN